MINYVAEVSYLVLGAECSLKERAKKAQLRRSNYRRAYLVQNSGIGRFGIVLSEKMNRTLLT